MILKRLRINVGIALVVFILVTANIIIFGLASKESSVKIADKNNIFKNNLTAAMVDVPGASNSDKEINKKSQSGKDDSKQGEKVSQSGSGTTTRKKRIHYVRRVRTRAS